MAQEQKKVKASSQQTLMETGSSTAIKGDHKMDNLGIEPSGRATQQQGSPGAEAHLTGMHALGPESIKVGRLRGERE